ncbi:hypothetical protein JTE90_027979 [Oedothorax gibbosus]|uniref:Uncharacterized protein n=1 Tax=Oedothorax gibbosus TaxID=931172 RepID=A0AAV6VGL9_9ARAC|nr:hypothetical protein JTE90_027979 [Oedothorax gibbosus]
MIGVSIGIRCPAGRWLVWRKLKFFTDAQKLFFKGDLFFEFGKSSTREDQRSSPIFPPTISGNRMKEPSSTNLSCVTGKKQRQPEKPPSLSKNLQAPLPPSSIKPIGARQMPGKVPIT